MRTILGGFLVAALAAGGCSRLITVDPSRVVEPPPGATAATAVVEAFYGLRARPQIYWYEATNCPDDPGATGIVLDYGKCVSGTQDSEHDNDVIILALFPALKIHEMALAHELGHRASHERGEGGDSDHVGHFFAPGGDVEQANAIVAQTESGECAPDKVAKITWDCDGQWGGDAICVDADNAPVVGCTTSQKSDDTTTFQFSCVAACSM